MTEETPVLIRHARLGEFIAEVLAALGMPQHIVEPTAEPYPSIFAVAEVNGIARAPGLAPLA